jgi:hypothetical protein
MGMGRVVVIGVEAGLAGVSTGARLVSGVAFLLQRVGDS